MIDELKNFVAEGMGACKILVVGDGNVTLHPMSALGRRKIFSHSPRFEVTKNFCGGLK